ncbi:bifunctional lysine-specific demethylase and histidyl-hydroxylase NO66 [Drosophila navojoa]|nr:bifunctional lysine-specific demethylase and histidyl-hydroxylase NO66 [Drosophila navojoa]
MNNNKNKPTAAKQQKMSQKQEQAPVGKQRANPAPSCPLPPRPVKTMIKSCPLPPKAPAAKPVPSKCRLSSRESTGKKTPAKSCRLSSAPADKMANKMAAPSRKSTSKNNNNNNNEINNNNKENGLNSHASLVTGTETQRGPVHLASSIEEGKRMLNWLLNPITAESFFDQYWERNACQVKRKLPDYYSQLISFQMIDEMLIENQLEFTTNIDVTTYKKGVRQTLNPVGRAMSPAIWGYYGDGCSIRILNPSTYLPKLRQLCSSLQEFFHCLVGANVYLTPPNSQGFAPHYDDIEAFVVQVEGRKRWRLYAPPQQSDVLARTSSRNYKQEELGKPLFDAFLEAGDILYFPRGTVHQAVTDPKQHSLHITLSVYQQQAYANLLEALMPSVLERAIKHHLTLRRGLPLDIWQHVGLAKGGKQSEQRDQVLTSTKQLVQRYLMPTDAQIDAAVDQLAKRFQHEALPPSIKPEEEVRTVFGSRSVTDSHGQCLCDYELTENTKVRLLRANILRLVAEGSSLRVYYYVDNALEYCKNDPNYMEIQPTEAPAVEALITTYPKYLKIGKLPLRSADRRIEVATALWERGLLMTEKPFK